MASILPSQNDIQITPGEIKEYVNIAFVKDMMRQERQHWLLKTNRNVDYYSLSTNYKYSSTLQNEGQYQQIETRTFPDNESNPGYSGVFISGGEMKLPHDRETWPGAMSDDSKKNIAQRVSIGVSSQRNDINGFGLENGQLVDKSRNREASITFDSYDGRAYLLSNDEQVYTNGTLPPTTVARIIDIPKNFSDLDNDMNYVSDPDYHHTDNNYTHNDRYMIENLDDRTFVYPEISKDINGNYIPNRFIDLDGAFNYNETPGTSNANTQPDPNNDRQNSSANSINKNKNYSGVTHPNGYFPGVFRSYEELLKVDLLRQKRTPLNITTPGGRRRHNYYQFDGIFSHGLDMNTKEYDESFKAQNLEPSNMEVKQDDRQPVPFRAINQDTIYSTDQLYQWRYNRVIVNWHSKNLTIRVDQPGVGYKVNDILRYNFTDEVINYQVDTVGTLGELISGHYIIPSEDHLFEQDPSTLVGIGFSSYIGTGRDATLIISCKATISTHSTQLKNNLYAYVDVVPTVRSDNSSPWSDNKPMNDPNVVYRSTTGGPAYSGINSGTGGPSDGKFYEHGGNATAGPQIHLFRYVINTATPEYEDIDNVRVYKGRWVDQGPISALRPADIKALYLSNENTNNFGNSYKFTLDILLHIFESDPDQVITGDNNTFSECYKTVAQSDPTSDKRFYKKYIDSSSLAILEKDITDKIIWINAASGVMFHFNRGVKNDIHYGYANNAIGWQPIAGTISGAK